MVRRTPGSALLPYATLFRSKLYRQGVSGEGELAEGFPKTEEELFAYDGLMLGSVEASFFTAEQLRAVEAFVARRGGGIVAIGGGHAFGGRGGGEKINVIYYKHHKSDCGLSFVKKKR